MMVRMAAVITCMLVSRLGEVDEREKRWWTDYYVLPAEQH